MSKQGSGRKIIARNKRSSFDYELLEKFEAGIVLTGTEIKSVRANQVSLQGSFVRPREDELWLLEASIAPYKHGNQENHELTRPRKLLLHRREINKILEGLQQKGLTIVPTQLYLKRGLAKVEIALARGKASRDKRADLARKDAQRQVERALREKYR